MMHQAVCACGEPGCPAEGGGFYVTVVRGRRVGYLLGPFGTHEAALAKVPLGQQLAERVDPWTAFDAFGTARVNDAPLPRAKLNDLAAAEPGKVLKAVE